MLSERSFGTATIINAAGLRIVTDRKHGLQSKGLEAGRNHLQSKSEIDYLTNKNLFSPSKFQALTNTSASDSLGACA